ncbi:MAG TPA: hypothetical protein VGH28_34390 [Polyangiaceae bacterium]|jgi:hypothetical protein
MRAHFALASMFVFALGACTSLLGDFDVGDGGTETEGGPDAPTDAPTLQKVHCVAGATPTNITTNNALQANQLRMAVFPDGRARMVVPDFEEGDAGAEIVLHAYTIDKGDASVSADVQTTLPTNRVLAVERYNGTPPGFAALYEQRDTSTNLALYLATLPDNAPSWTTSELGVSPANGVAGASTNATFAVTGPSSNQYFIAYSVTSATSQDIYVGNVTSGGAGPIPLMKAANFGTSNGNEAYSFNEPAIAIEPGANAYVMLAPSNKSGPPKQGAQVQIVVPGPNNASFALTPPGTLNYFPSGFTGSGGSDKANMAMLVASLDTYTGGYYVGQVPYASLSSSFDPTTLTPTIVQGADGGSVDLKQLFIGGSTQHWEVPPQNSSEQLLMVGPSVDLIGPTRYPGINFAWWDGATGQNRTFQTGDDDLLGTVSNVAVADVAFIGLSGSVGTFLLAYIADKDPPPFGGSPGPGDLVITSLGCQP